MTQYCMLSRAFDRKSLHRFVLDQTSIHIVILAARILHQLKAVYWNESVGKLTKSPWTATEIQSENWEMESCHDLLPPKPGSYFGGEISLFWWSGSVLFYESNPESRVLFRARCLSSESKVSAVSLTSAAASNIRKNMKENNAVEVNMAVHNDHVELVFKRNILLNNQESGCWSTTSSIFFKLKLVGFTGRNPSNLDWENCTSEHKAADEALPTAE